METGGKGIRRADEIGDGRRMRGVASVDRGQNLGVRGREEVSAEGGVQVLAEAGGEAVSVEGLEKAGGEEVTVGVRDEFSAERKPVDKEDHLSKVVGIGEEVTVAVRDELSAERKPVDQEDRLTKMAGTGEVRDEVSAERKPVDQEEMVGIGEGVTSEGGGGKEEEEGDCGKEEDQLFQGKQKEEVGRGKQKEVLCIDGVGGKLTAEVNSAQGIFIGAGPVAGRPTRWADLPRELIEKIATDHLECAVDKVNISLISRHWRFSRSATQHIPLLPWLFLPSPKEIVLQSCQRLLASSSCSA
ncbi:hypothetical protein VPH35_027523 [Triticum aestivum]|uniref:uncharacterized protein n=1 Tax=Triticum aestivum TaxID=4565 RepID=UPI001D01E5FE|nr:uncharacterized protein LOC123043974 [Triticum aestivum]